MLKEMATLVLLSSVLLTACSSHESQIVTTDTIQPSEEPRINDQTPVAPAKLIERSEHGHVKLYAIKEVQRNIEGVTLDINGQQQDFEWYIPHTGAAGPQVFYTDLTGDGIEEAVVIINIGRGTGLNQYDIHVINSSDFSEIKVHTYDEVVAEHISNSVTIIDEQTIDIQIQAKEKEYHFTAKVNLPPDFEQNELGFGGVYIYFIDNQQIFLNMGASVGISPQYVADVKASFTYDPSKKEFIVDEIDVTQES